MTKFGELAKRILNEPICRNFAHCGDSDAPADMSKLLKWFQVYTKDNKQHAPESNFMMAMYESILRSQAGDTTAAEMILTRLLAQESLSSSASTRWEDRAIVHHMLYNLAVINTDKPDHQKGLTHLDGIWKLRRGVGLPKLQLCY